MNPALLAGRRRAIALRIEPSVLHGLFEQQVDANSDRAAVLFDRKETTYAELEGWANRLARHLLAHDVHRRSVVALMVPQSPDAYSALLGILKAGAAYVPIDPDVSAERVARILEDSGARAIVTTRHLSDRITAFDGIVIRIDGDRGAIAGHPDSRLPRRDGLPSERDLCYIIYTLGATGQPKGVMVEHRSAFHLVRAEGEILGVHPRDRVYQGSSLALDASVEEIWLAFHAGATLVPATPEMEQAGPGLSQFLAESRVTVLSCAPTLLSMLREDVPTLRLIILGGETCPSEVVDRWFRPGRRLVYTYRPSEAAIVAAFADLAPGKPVTIGRTKA